MAACFDGSGGPEGASMRVAKKKKKQRESDDGEMAALLRGDAGENRR